MESPSSAYVEEIESLISNLTALHTEMYSKVNQVDKSTLKENFFSVVDQQLITTIDWAKRLPGYRDLEISDQAILLQAAWVDLILLNWLFHSLSASNVIKLCDNLSLNTADAVALGFENIYGQLLLLVVRAKKYNIDEEDMACLKAIGLMNAGIYRSFQIVSSI